MSGRPVSKKTQDLVDAMAASAGLTPFQLRQLKSATKAGQSLPTVVPPSSSQIPLDIDHLLAANSSSFIQQAYRPSYMTGKLKKDDCEKPERDTFRPRPPKFNREKEKDKLATFMEFEGKPPPKPKPMSMPSAPIATVDRFDELLDEVAERQEWLDSMKQMGKTDQYEPIIRAQISERVAEMRKMDRERAAVHGFDRVPSSSSSSNSLIADGSDRH